MSQVAATQKLVEKFEGSGLPVKFFHIYNREAHLDWQAPSTESRHQRALYFKQMSEITSGVPQVVTTLVDEVEPGKFGSSVVNELYGGSSNQVVIADENGKIIYYNTWYSFGEVDQFLTKLGEQRGWASDAKLNQPRSSAP